MVTTDRTASGAPNSCCVPAFASTQSDRRQQHFGVDDSAADNRHDWRDLAGGWYQMGTDNPLYPQDGEAPARRVMVDAFSISATAVTCAQFRRFIDATGYQTESEQTGWSFVFQALLARPSAYRAAQNTPWWLAVPGACWHHPAGADGAAAIDDHPVVHISQRDARYYCEWSATRLASEAEWEYAARGGLEDQPFPWGAQFEPDGERRCNVWRGDFPNGGAQYPHYAGTVAAAAYPANGYGLYNMTGNVWEWVADRFTTLHSPRPVKNPRGPLNPSQYVSRGGSYLCHSSYCSRYHVFSRQALAVDTTAGNLGFRVVKRR